MDLGVTLVQIGVFLLFLWYLLPKKVEKNVSENVDVKDIEIKDNSSDSEISNSDTDDTEDEFNAICICGDCNHKDRVYSTIVKSPKLRMYI